MFLSMESIFQMENLYRHWNDSCLDAYVVNQRNLWAIVYSILSNSKIFKLNQHELQKNSKYIFIYYWPKKAERVQQLSTAMAMLWDINEMTWGAPNQSKILSMWYIAFLDKFSSFWCNSGTETSGNPFLNLVLHHYFILIGSFDFWNVREKSFIWQLWWDQQHNLSWI